LILVLSYYTQRFVMGEQSASRLEGDRYQHLYSWFKILDLLDPGQNIEKIWLEHPKAEATDDVTVHPRITTGKPTRYYQIKWHVDHRSGYSMANLIHRDDHSTSLLEKFWKSWKKLNSTGDIELWLVSNWSSQPDDHLGELIQARTGQLKDELITASAGSQLGRWRKQWQDHLGADNEDFESFYHSLRFRLGFASMTELEQMVDLKMQAYGLSQGDDVRSIAIDNVRKWIEEGETKKVITLAKLKAELKQHKILLTSHTKIIQDHLDSSIIKESFGASVRLVNPANLAPAEEEEVRRYYEGAPLTWGVIAAHGDVERDLYGTLINSFSTQSNRIHFLCLRGEPGAGKSTLAWRVAAEVAQATSRPLLHVLANKENEAWYKLEAFYQEREIPLIVLVDDVFRDEEAQTALASLRPDLNVIIIATSRSNEIPDDLRLPFPLQFQELLPPTPNEKDCMLKRLGMDKQALDASQKKRLQKANSWLVLMIETTRGEELTKIVRNSVKRLREQDEIVYQAYEYLCYIGQYDLYVPETLIAALDKRGRFYQLLEHPVSKGLIFGGNQVGVLRTQHPTIAREALKAYRRDPQILAGDIINGIEAVQRAHRGFFIILLRRLLWDQQEILVRNLLEQKAEVIDTIISASGNAELFSWAQLFERLHDWEKARMLYDVARTKIPETSIDWLACLRHNEGREQFITLIDSAITWLVNSSPSAAVLNALHDCIKRYGTEEQMTALVNVIVHRLTVAPQSNFVHTLYLEIVEQFGTKEQLQSVIDASTLWLATKPNASTIRETYIRLVGHYGTIEQKANAIDNINIWLLTKRQAISVRAAYFWLVANCGTERQCVGMLNDVVDWLAANSKNHSVSKVFFKKLEQYMTDANIASLIDVTAERLISNQQNDAVKRVYHRLVERFGTKEQIRALIDVTITWLVADIPNRVIQPIYLEQVKRCGSLEQKAFLIDEIANWLALNLNDIIIRCIYLGLVKQYGLVRQRAIAIESTAAWLIAHPQGKPVRKIYLLLVEHHGSREQITNLIILILNWLVTDTENSDIPLIYYRFVERHGTKEQITEFLNVITDLVASSSYNANIQPAFLGLVRRHGTAEQVSKVIEAVTACLVSNPQNDNVQPDYLWLVRHHGTAEQVSKVIDAVTACLVADPQHADVEPAFLGLVRHHGTAEQVAKANNIMFSRSTVE
jgi:hypothetical protein